MSLSPSVNPVKPSANAGSAPVRRAAQNHHHVVAPSLNLADNAAASVFAAARMRGPLARDAIARLTSLSIATVNRQVGALLEAGLLRERADLSASGAIGRPRVPVEVNHEPFMTLGIHIGARTTNIVATDLLGRTLDVVEIPTAPGRPEVALAGIAETAKRYLRRWHRRRTLWVGVAVGGIVDSASGTVTHPRLGWLSAPVGAILASVLGLRVSVASHVDSMAAAELILGLRRFTAPHSTSLYVYARETVGYALVIDGRVHSPQSGPGSIAGLPVHSELLGHSGTLESTVSDEAVLTAARRLRILPRDGVGSTVATLLQVVRNSDRDGRGTARDGARQLLNERARVLGESLALLRDVLNPDEIVVGGQAFTTYPEGIAELEKGFASKSILPQREIRMTAFGNRVQEAGAGIVSLSALYADPIAAMRRAQAIAVTPAGVTAI